MMKQSTRTCRRLRISTLFLFLLVVPGCGPEERLQQKQSRVDSVSPDSVSLDVQAAIRKQAYEPVTVIDRAGRLVTFDSVPQRLISLSPSTTELLFAIGAGKSIVGATKHCNYPADALDIQRVGSGTAEGISREMIVTLKPDLVLCKYDTHEPLNSFFERVGIRAVNLGPESLEELFDETRLLGRCTGHEQEAEAFIQQMTERRDALLRRVSSLVGDQVRTVFYEVWDDPLMTAGPKSFIGELLRLAQMRNIFEDTNARYPRISSEVVVSRNPDVIIAPSNHMKQVEFSRLASRPGWANINAIRDERVYLINGDEVSRCGPRLLNALEQMIDVVYPHTRLVELHTQ